jgi:hypothetical protein
VQPVQLAGLDPPPQYVHPVQRVLHLYAAPSVNILPH